MDAQDQREPSHPARFSPAMCGMLALMADNLFTSALVPILPDIAHNCNLSLSSIGWILSTRSLVQLLHSLTLSGPLVHHFGAVGIFLFGLFVEIASCGLTAHAGSLAVFLGAQVAHGIGASAFTTAALTLIVQSTDNGSRGKSLGIFYSGIAYGYVAGTAIGGSVYQHIGQVALFWIIAGFFGIVVVISFFALPKSGSLAQMQPSDFSPMMKLFADLRIKMAMLSMATSAACVGNTLVLFPNYFHEYFDFGSEKIGFLMMSGPAGYLFASQVAGYFVDRTAKHRIAMVGLAAIALSFALFSVSQSRVVSAVACYAIGFASTSFVDVSQPAFIAATVEQLEGSYTAGAALGDAAVGIGYATMVFVSWLQEQLEMATVLSITAGWCGLVLVALAVIFERRSS